jgi:hypothetical protein
MISAKAETNSLPPEQGFGTGIPNMVNGDHHGHYNGEDQARYLYAKQFPHQMGSDF